MSITSRLSASTIILSAFRSADNPNRRSTSPGRKLGLTDAFGVVARATIAAGGVSVPSNFGSAYSRLGSTIVAGITANWLAPPLGNAPWWDLW